MTDSSNGAERHRFEHLRSAADADAQQVHDFLRAPAGRWVATLIVLLIAAGLLACALFGWI